MARLHRVGVSPAEAAGVRAELQKLVGRPVSAADVFWVSANLRLLDAAAASDWARVVVAYREMGDLLRSEGRATGVLDQQREVAEHRAAAQAARRAGAAQRAGAREEACESVVL